jgi:hypothetical protein
MHAIIFLTKKKTTKKINAVVKHIYKKNLFNMRFISIWGAWCQASIISERSRRFDVFC